MHWWRRPQAEWGQDELRLPLGKTRGDLVLDPWYFEVKMLVHTSRDGFVWICRICFLYMITHAISMHLGSFLLCQLGHRSLLLCFDLYSYGCLWILSTVKPPNLSQRKGYIYILYIYICHSGPYLARGCAAGLAYVTIICRATPFCRPHFIELFSWGWLGIGWSSKFPGPILQRNICVGLCWLWGSDWKRPHFVEITCFPFCRHVPPKILYKVGCWFDNLFYTMGWSFFPSLGWW